MIQVCTRLWPEPGPRAQIIQHSRYPMRVVEAPVSETGRRKNHIDLIDPNHTLLPITIDCLQFQDKDRPSSEELCQRLAGLKESREYRESTKQNHHDQIQAQAQQLQEKDRLLQQRADEITSQNQQLQEKDTQLKQQSRLHQEETASRERQFRQQLEEQEQVTAEIQQTNHSLQRQVEQLQQQLSQQSLKPPQPPPPSQAQVRGRQLQERESLKQLPVQPSLQVDHKPHPLKIGGEITFNWRDGGKVPLMMSRGAAVEDENVVYFVTWDSNILCSYDSSSKRWRGLSRCPYQYCNLAIVNGQLTAVGGMDSHLRCINKLLSLQTGRKEVFPPMPTKQRSTTAVTSKEHLVVAGGATGPLQSDIISIVEVMDTKTLVWSTVASLPHPYFRASGTICGDQLYMLGGWDDKGMKTKSVLTCSLTELLQSSSSSSSIWHRVADAPANYSTCAAVNGELLAVGGCDKHLDLIAAIHKYNPTINSWDLISNMPTARYWSLVAVLPTNEMMVVGGRSYSELSKCLEIAEF